MNRKTQQEDMTTKRIVYRTSGMDSVKIRRDVEYRTTDEGPLTMDIYYPPEADGKSPIPVIIFVTGYPDPGYERRMGCKQKDMGQYVSWAELTAASGLVAITYCNVKPREDADALLRYLRGNAESLGLDANRIGIWSCSGNVPNALSVLIDDGGANVRCAALYYGMMLDLDGSTDIEEASSEFGFVNPTSGMSVQDFSDDVSLFIVRACSCMWSLTISLRWTQHLQLSGKVG